MLSWVRSLLSLVAVLRGLSGCSSTKFPAPPDVAAKDYSYVIGAGDALNILVWRNPELSMSVPVRPDGKIAARWSMSSWCKGRLPVRLRAKSKRS